ncbi:class I adenylate-forming enzyme family protein [Pseudogemmobacter sp. W21_MBD1_M6]|uniref:class I adenylate-forming enzyme family protein n=1 Tax=Pseudogemmobacter sp. W21_MBD1_M6 TaxID=3240271 RepID=UPI003F9C35FD
MVSEFNTGAPAPCPVPFNMAQYVLGAAADNPHKIALSVIGTDGDEHWTYAELEQAVRSTAAGFLDLGLTAGERVLMRLGNTVDFPIVFLAAIAVDLVPVPTSSQLTRFEVNKIAADLSPSLIVAGRSAALPEAPDCPVLDIAALHELRANVPADYVAGDPDRLGYIIYTSGTSGIPRAVMHAHRAVWARRMMWDGWYGLTPDDRMLHAGAFNWTYTLGTGLMDPWTIGATALIPADGVTAAELPHLLRRENATIFAAAPGVYRQLLKSHLKVNLPTLRHGLSAGEKLPEATRTAWETATGTLVFEAYGMSECSTFISGSPSRPAIGAASGYPQAGRRIAVVDDVGHPVPLDAAGTLAIHASDPGLMLGYLGACAETRAKFKGDWFLTGDTGSMAADGAITYLGRVDDMMNAGGFRVSPVEVEAVMTTHPRIAECAAVEVKIKTDVTVIALFYVSEIDIPDPDLLGFSETRLARYKTPRLFIRVNALPKGANNKLLRRALRQTYEARHGQA